MKILWLFLSVLFIPLINANLTAIAYPTSGSADLPDSGTPSALQQAIIDNLRESLTQQHTQDLQIITILLALTIGLACVVIALAVIFLKKRRTFNK